MKEFLKIFANLKWQLFISVSLTLASAIYTYPEQGIKAFLLDFNQLSIFLGAVGSILALTTSLSFSFILYYVSQTNTKKSNLYYSLKSFLHDFDKFLDELPASYDLIYEARAFSYDTKKIQYEDFPMTDDERKNKLSKIMDKLESEVNEDDPNIHNKILEYLMHIEDFICGISRLCISQAISGVYVKTFMKSVIIICSIMLTVLAAYLNLNNYINFISMNMPIFFTIFSCMLISEIAWFIYRHVFEDME